VNASTSRDVWQEFKAALRKNRSKPEKGNVHQRQETLAGMTQ